MTAMPGPARWNIEAEQCLLGAILVNNGAYGAAIKHVDSTDFFEPLHAQIFEEAGRLIVAGRTATPVTLKDAFPNVKLGDDPNDLTISQYLARLCAEATTIINAPDYAHLIRELAMMREIIGIAADLERAPSDGRNSDEALRQAFEQIDSLRAGLTAENDERASIGRLAKELSARMQSAEALEAEGSISTGFIDLDRQLGGGYRDGRLIVLAGRPGAGKTVFKVASSRRVARKGNGVLIFSLEMPRNDIMARFVASELAHTDTPLDYRDILVGNLDQFQRERVAVAAANLEPLPIEIDTTVGLSIFEIAARARITCERWRQRSIKPGLIAIDYLGLIRSSDRYRGNRTHEIGETAKGAKLLAGQLQTCVLLLAQINRSVESRDDRRPVMSDLRDSGEIEEHADVVALMYRPNYYDQRNLKVRQADAAAIEQMEQRKYDLDIGLDKNRLGPTATVRLWCDVGRSAVDNARRYE